jgi:hypothetical protein
MWRTLVAGVGSPQLDVERVLSQVVEFAPNGVALTNADGRILLPGIARWCYFPIEGVSMRRRSRWLQYVQFHSHPHQLRQRA